MQKVIRHLLALGYSPDNIEQRKDFILVHSGRHIQYAIKITKKVDDDLTTIMEFSTLRGIFLTDGNEYMGKIRVGEELHDVDTLPRFGVQARAYLNRYAPGRMTCPTCEQKGSRIQIMDTGTCNNCDPEEKTSWMLSDGPMN